MPQVFEVQVLGIGKRPVRDVFTASCEGMARVMAKDKYGGWIRLGDVKEVLTRKQREEARKAKLPSRAKSRRIKANSLGASRRTTRWQPPTETQGPPTYLWG